MPNETNAAIAWAKQQTFTDDMGNTLPITINTDQPLVDKVREYLNTNAIPYTTFSYDDLKIYF